MKVPLILSCLIGFLGMILTAVLAPCKSGGIVGKLAPPYDLLFLTFLLVFVWTLGVAVYTHRVVLKI